MDINSSDKKNPRHIKRLKITEFPEEPCNDHIRGCQHTSDCNPKDVQSSLPPKTGQLAKIPTSENVLT
jgi:hypothetical protein